MAKEEIKQEEIVLSENEIICLLTNKIVKVTDKETTLQYMIQMMSEEYGFAMEDMERDFSFKYTDDEERRKTAKITLAIFEPGTSHDSENLARAIIVAKDAKVKANDTKAGVMASLENILTFSDCDYGCWTNGEDLQFLAKIEDEWGQVTISDFTDFPAAGQSMVDLIQLGDKAAPRKPANESLVKTFKRCHDYIYANEGMKKTAFWELLNLKIGRAHV